MTTNVSQQQPPLGTSTDGDVSDYDIWMRRRGLSQTTIHHRLKFARRFHRIWGTWDVPAEQLVDWLTQYSGWTRQTYRGHVTGLGEWLVETGRRQAAPLADTRAWRTPKARPRPLTPEEFTRAVDAATPQTQTYLLLAGLAGLRAHEVAKFRGCDINSDTIRVVGKGGLLAEVPTHPQLWATAGHYPQVGYWFPGQTDAGHVKADTVTKAVSVLFDRLGINGSLHRARHYYGSSLLRAGHNIRVVQELMRHSSLATTEGYLDVTEGERATAIRSLAVPSGIRR